MARTPDDTSALKRLTRKFNTTTRIGKTLAAVATTSALAFSASTMTVVGSFGYDKIINDQPVFSAPTEGVGNVMGVAGLIALGGMGGTVGAAFALDAASRRRRTLTQQQYKVAVTYLQDTLTPKKDAPRAP